MITKSSRLNLSNNESIADVSVASNCDRLVTDTNSSETSNEEPLVELDTSRPEAVVLGSNYIEQKIKSLLNRDDDEENDPQAGGSKIAEQLVQQERISGILTTEDSCNAVDHKISSGESAGSESEVPAEELSFNGKIKSLKAAPMEGHSSQCELTDATKGFERMATNDKVCRDKLNESFELLTKENSSLMHYNNEKSPDLFADDDDNEDDSAGEEAKSDSEVPAEDKSFNTTLANTSDIIDPVDRIEKSILKRFQASLSGVLPPPSVTYSRIDVSRMLALYKENEARLFYRNDEVIEKPVSAVETADASTSPTVLNKPTHTLAELAKLEWPELLKSRAHGLYYNRSTVSEKIELLGLKYVDRYIGAETSSTFNVSRSPSSAKKRNQRLKMLNQSPGSRLSHLARRRAVFSSANLLNSSIGSVTATASSSSSSAAFSQPNPLRLCNRQILLDPKKSDNRRKNKGRTPKRRTPGRRKTPRRKTPGSSAKKRTLSLPVAKPVQQPASRETSKRALFQSPPNEASKAACLASVSAAVSTAVASRVQKSKRALFSPPKRAHRFSSVSGSRSDLSIKESLMTSQRYGSSTQIDMLKESSGVKSISTGLPVELGETSGKRKRTVELEDEEKVKKSGKLPRMDSINEEDLTPRSLKFARSQSFCVGSQNLNTRTASETAFCGKSLFRASSEVTFPESVSRPVTMLTENHKKKLLWAVSQALQTKQISVKHESFKHYASNLARVVKRLFLEFNDPTVSSTSEKLLRLANKHVFEVIHGSSVDDIYLKEKTRIMNAKNVSKLQGYIAPEEYEQRKQLMKRSTSTSVLISDNSMDSSFCATSSQLLSQSSIFSQSSEFLNQLSQSSTRHSLSTTAVSTVVVVPAGDATSSENTILRENIDSEQRQKSAQKQISFSGKDQKNLSPYADNKAGSQAKAKLLVGGAITSSILKAKRQISFE